MREEMLIGAGSELNWPVYTLEQPENMVFFANETTMGYVEPDTYRADGIAYISSNLLPTIGLQSLQSAIPGV
jgi:hypothetical protein